MDQFAVGSFLFLVGMPGATSSVLATIVVMPVLLEAMPLCPCY